MAYPASTFEFRDAANDEDPVAQLRSTVLALVERSGTDLTARQMAVLLTAYLDAGPHTVTNLSARLRICKPAVTRALNRLGDLGLVRRSVDPEDRRSAPIHRTAAGLRLLADLRTAAAQDAAGVQPAPAPWVGSSDWFGAILTHRAGYGHGFAANTATD